MNDRALTTQRQALSPAQLDQSTIARKALAGEESLLEPLARLAEIQAPLAAHEPSQERAQQLLPCMPTEDQMRAMAEELGTALRKSPDRRINRILVGLLLDAFPSARIGQPEVMIEAMCHDLESAGFPPIVIAKACRDLRGQRTFVPAIAEVLAAASEVSADLMNKPENLLFQIRNRDYQLAKLTRIAKDSSSSDTPPVMSAPIISTEREEAMRRAHMAERTQKASDEDPDKIPF